MKPFVPSKRELVRAAGIAGMGLVAASFGGPALSEDAKEEVTPPEDLMREHGVLDRALLLYEEAIRKFSAKEDFNPALVTQSAEIIRDFINNYHEKSEEEHVFPRFRKAGKMVDLVDALQRQHNAGRQVTATILALAPESRQEDGSRPQLVGAMQSFITMYRPHAAREDTDLFPQLRDVVSSNEFDSMAEEFEKKEHELFGEDGFEKTAQRVAVLEMTMGIHDLNKFTPR
ncbi:MAG TPA: hemerythrin domain-containing protein [Xanthobacteraceae bacterium]|nr:hemerythrin domain-containing protein [Xanthobacteraceae bacterium]